MIPRQATHTLKKLAGQYKIVAVTGPRQSGKTTLVRHLFGHYTYVNLENIDLRTYAEEDPRGFLQQYGRNTILDEAQRVPTLFSYLQQQVDEDKQAGQYILTGSNNFLLQENISQSLAGRIGYLHLLPLTLTEVPQLTQKPVEQAIFKGFYPPLYDQVFDISQWYGNYISTYVERDVRQIKNITRLDAFGRFLKLTAGRIGQLLNLHNLAIESGVDSKTIQSWLGILESSFIVYRLAPFHKNFNKRVVKTPKLYFYDTGLACSLLSISSSQQLESHPLRGNLFENFCISEFLKDRFNQGKRSNFYFWRDNTGHEIDLVIEQGNQPTAVEIKSGKTITNEFFKGLQFWQKLTGNSQRAIVYGGDLEQKRSDQIRVISWKNISQYLAEIQQTGQ